MRKKHKITLLMLTMILVVLGVPNVLALTSCTGYTYSSGSGSADYFGVNTATPNTTTLASTSTIDYQWTAFSFFVPRLNFTVPVNETVVGGNTTQQVTLSWLSTETPTAVKIYNDTTLLGAGNYTIISGGSNTWILNHTNDVYLGQTLLVVRNRTFVKNVDDIAVGYASLYTGATKGMFLVENTTGYGDVKAFQLNATSLGQYISGNNWAVGYTYNIRTCAAVDQTSITGITNAKTTAFAALGLLGVMLIVMAAFAVVKIFQGGGADLGTMATVIIGGGIVLILGFFILYQVSVGLIG